MSAFKSPTFKSKSFTCPHCDTLSQHDWLTSPIWTEKSDSILIYQTPILSGTDKNKSLLEKNIFISCCTCCEGICLWYNEELVAPKVAFAPPPNPDLDSEVILDYNEARKIAYDSPRGSTALLRLCIQKLCKQLGKSGKNINRDIALLVKDGLPQKIQQSLDIIRVIGNNAVHPGELDIRDDRQTALKLFNLINYIAYDRITRLKKIDDLYSSLPEEERKKIEKRDKKLEKNS